MIRKNKVQIIITSIATILPVVIGLLLWNKMPDQVAIHWGLNGEPDSYGPKAVAVFVLPAVLLGCHLLCVFASKFDPKHKDINPKMFSIVLWICPAISIIMNTMVYLISIGKQIKFVMIVILFMGLMFVVIGNYLPKCRQSYTMGIKLPWTLENEENWNKTHRMAGVLWVIGGIVILATAIFESYIIFFSVVALMVIVPTIYSYVYYKKHK